MAVILKKLKSRPLFLRVASTGKHWVTPGFILQVSVRRLESKDKTMHDEVRVGYTVSKKVGHAVVRNRVKRRLRAAVEKVFVSEAKSGRDYVLIGRKVAYRQSFDSLLSDMKWSLKKLDARIKP